VNPLDDEKKVEKTEKRLLKEVLISKDNLEIQQRMQVFKVHTDDEWVTAVLST